MIERLKELICNAGLKKSFAMLIFDLEEGKKPVMKEQVMESILMIKRNYK